MCEYQCNGAMAGAKKYKKAPFMIAEDVAVYLKESSYFETVEVVKPGFINLKLAPQSVADYLNQMSETEKLGVEEAEEPKTIMIDYGGPNVAKPLHVGHLRSAIIGESVKRIARFKGNKVIGDIHLGDWGYQMGLIITELKKRKPELPYFDENFTGEYPAEAPFTIRRTGGDISDSKFICKRRRRIQERSAACDIFAPERPQRIQGGLESHHECFGYRS